MAASIVIPTLNEEESIGTVISELKEQSSDYEIVVVDDSSLDSTREVAKTSGAKVIHRRTERDLSRSIMNGIRRANNDKIVVMDGDGQHPPERVPELLETLESSEIAVGARESVKGEWSLTRKILSYGSQLGAESIFEDCKRTDDCVSGFFGLRKSDIDLEELNPRGYKILIEILVRCSPETEDIGYIFNQRLGGGSSIGVESLVEMAGHCFHLKLREIRDDGPAKAVRDPVLNFFPWIGYGRSGILRRR